MYRISLLFIVSNNKFQVPAVKHWLNSITSPSVALATETGVIATSSSRKTTPASGSDRQKSTQRAATTSPVLSDEASVKTPTTQVRKRLSSESAIVKADKTPASVARRTPAVKLSASALKSTARKSSAARAVIKSAVRKSVACSAVKTKPLWSEVLKNRRSVGVKTAATIGKITAAAVRKVAKKVKKMFQLYKMLFGSCRKLKVYAWISKWFSTCVCVHTAHRSNKSQDSCQASVSPYNRPRPVTFTFGNRTSEEPRDKHCYNQQGTFVCCIVIFTS